MNPRIGRRSQYNKRKEKPKPKAVQFVEQNTKKSIAMKQHFLYLEDVKIAMNIHHLEVSIILKRWLKSEIHQEIEVRNFVKMLEESIEKDRHRLQKEFKISV